MELISLYRGILDSSLSSSLKYPKGDISARRRGDKIHEILRDFECSLLKDVSERPRQLFILR